MSAGPIPARPPAWVSTAALRRMVASAERFGAEIADMWLMADAAELDHALAVAARMERLARSWLAGRERELRGSM